MSHRVAIIPLVSTVLLACGGAPPAGEDVAEETLEVEQHAATIDHDNWTYYIVTRQDFRRCVWPLCGGVYVERVNQPKTKCADGRFADECYVGGIDLSALGYPGDMAADVNATIVSGRAVIRGRIAAGTYEHFPQVGAFLASEVWGAPNDTAPSGVFYRAHDHGIVCITYPCGQVTAVRLNRNARPVYELAGIDLSRTGATDDELAKAREVLLTDNLVVAGRLTTVRGPAGRAQALRASQFYFPIVAPPQPTACGSRGMAPCPDGQFCNFTDGGCGAADVPGECQVVPSACILVYEPVCGCDGQTYSNACDAASSGVSVASPGECKAPQAACAIGGCSGEVCYPADQDAPITLCEWRPEYDCYRQHGECAVQPDGSCGWTETRELMDCQEASR